MKNKHVFDYLLEKISKSNEKTLLPSENYLCQKFNLSRTSIRDIYLILEYKNLVTTIKGKGRIAKLSENSISSVNAQSQKVIKSKKVFYMSNLLNLQKVKF